MDTLAKWFLKTGFFLMLFGTILVLLKRHHPAGKLPGDLVLRSGRDRFVLPFGTIGLGVLVLTVYLNLLQRDSGSDS
ncbi:MAG TPA: DUF2905 domain-containing protein [Candidatus Latescibacteria bacterium]|jgi:hypothetical protein|nr:DUF2905 domain-containing protein [Candidatus Latescibacterota bacterium]HRS94849.1 DUF2905 domain-containing protein [Candidatus Latescibacterota bacterium]